HLLVTGRRVVGPAVGRQVRVLRAHPGVVEAGRDRMRLRDLTVLVLHEERLHPVHHTGDATPDGRTSRRLHAHETGTGVDEAGEGSGGVRPPADARDDNVGVAA